MGVVDISCCVVTVFYEVSLTIFMIIVWEGERFGRPVANRQLPDMPEVSQDWVKLFAQNK